ncbi:MAG: hypothetical protein ACRESX_08690 [Gammaproteobacteria bacterium]
MKNAVKSGLLVATVVIFFGAISNASAYSLLADKVHNLPTVLTVNGSLSGKYVRIKPYVAHDAKGYPLSVPASIIDIYTGALFWDSPKPSKVPPFVLPIPEALRSQVALYYAEEFGWVVAPRNWMLVSAGIGADGGGHLAFEAPNVGGKPKLGERGWMMMELSLGNIGSYGEADGIIPGAHQTMLTLWPDTFQEGPPPQLIPKPDTVEYPNPCTAVLRYRIAHSQTVYAVVYLGPKAWADVMTEIYLAIPQTQSVLAVFIMKTLLSKLETCVPSKGY